MVGMACQVAWNPNGTVPTWHTLNGLVPMWPTTELQVWPTKQLHKWLCPDPNGIVPNPQCACRFSSPRLGSLSSPDMFPSTILAFSEASALSGGAGKFPETGKSHQLCSWGQSVTGSWDLTKVLSPIWVAQMLPNKSWGRLPTTKHRYKTKVGGKGKRVFIKVFCNFGKQGTPRPQANLARTIQKD